MYPAGRLAEHIQNSPSCLTPPLPLLTPRHGPLPGLPRLSKTKVDKGDIEAVVGEFREFLETALDADGAEQSTIAEIR